MNTNHYCEFCDEFAGGTGNSFATWYGQEISDRTLLRTAHLRVLPSLGHLVRGYLLVVPEVHYPTLGDMPPAMIQEVEDVKRSLARLLQPIYGSYVFFEHGARSSDSGGCGIYHAHLHALPLQPKGTLPRLKEEFPHITIGSLADLGQVSDSSYLFYEDSSGDQYVFFPKALPSQYLRRILAEDAGISQWDWRLSGREEALLTTRLEISDLISTKV